MKAKRLLAALLAAIISLSIFAVPSFAIEKEEAHQHIEVIILDDVSDELKEKATAYFLSGAHNNSDNDNTATYGLTCSILGHKLESVTSSVITHKASATAPRCVKRTYLYDACSRCDYEASTLISTQYIYCCA